jgi:hypothetical protein
VSYHPGQLFFVLRTPQSDTAVRTHSTRDTHTEVPLDLA